MAYLQDLINLMNDRLSNKVALFATADQEKYTDQAIREGLFEILGEDKLTWQGWRNHKNEIFTIMETVLNTNLPAAWDANPFFQQFVEISNGALGEKNEFVVEDHSVLYASRFSGNHWDTDRQKLQGRRTFSLATEWIVVRVYDELDRFLVGAIDLPTMMARMQTALENEINARVYASFSAIGTYLPSQFVETGDFDKARLAELCDRVETASQKDCIIAGTRTAFAQVVDNMDANWISEAAKQEYGTSGMVLVNAGLPCPAVLIPRSFVRGTYDFIPTTNDLFILPNNEKPIKLRFEGDTRALDLTPQDTHDMTYDSQIQTLVGCGVVVSNLMGKYSLES